MAAHRRVKTLGNYLCWTKVRIGIEEVHFVALYIEPGSGEGVVKTTVKALNVIKDIVAQDKEVKIIVGGDLNQQLSRVGRELVKSGFKEAIGGGPQNRHTHVAGNQLDQLWVRNLALENVVVGEFNEQVSDHTPIIVKVSQWINRSKEKKRPNDFTEVVRRSELKQTTIRRITRDPDLVKAFQDDRPHLMEQRWIDVIPEEIVQKHAPKESKKRPVRYHKPAQHQVDSDTL